MSLIGEKHAKEVLSKTPESEISDGLFFELITADSSYLGYPFAQEKIERWKEEAASNDSRKIGKVARENLIRIGYSLAIKAHSKRVQSTANYADIAARFHDNLSKVDGISKCRQEANKRVRLREVFGDAMAGMDKVPNTDIEVAYLVTAKQTGKKLSTVKTYVKKERKAPTVPIAAYSCVIKNGRFCEEKEQVVGYIRTSLSKNIR